MIYFTGFPQFRENSAKANDNSFMSNQIIMKPSICEFSQTCFEGVVILSIAPC